MRGMRMRGSPENAEVKGAKRLRGGFRRIMADEILWEADLLERLAVLQSPARIEELVAVFVHATKVC